MFASQQAGIWWLIRVNNKSMFGPKCGTTLKELGLSFLYRRSKYCYIHKFTQNHLYLISVKCTYADKLLGLSQSDISEEMKNTSVKNATFHLQEGRWQSPAILSNPRAQGKTSPKRPHVMDFISCFLLFSLMRFCGLHKTWRYEIIAWQP